MAEPIEFDILLPKRTVFGWGKRHQLGTLGRSLGKRAFLIDGSKTLRTTALWGELLDSLQTAGITVEHVATAEREPTIEDVDAAAEAIRQQGVRSDDFVIGIGGGSALDLAKAAAAMAVQNGGSVRDYLEGIGTGRTLDAAPIPLIAVPTTAGTGSESTKNAVVSCADPACKKSLRSDRMLPAIALVDPELTVSMSQQQTVYSGMDTLTQLLESFTSKRSQPATDLMCLRGLSRGLVDLPQAYVNGESRQAREGMAYAALQSGAALANSGLGLAHAVAAALGSICGTPHGLACATMLPIALVVNYPVTREKLKRLDEMPPMSRLNLDQIDYDDSVGRTISYIEWLCHEFEIPIRLRDLGVKKSQIPQLVQGSHGNSLNGNPRELDDSELREILEANW